MGSKHVTLSATPEPLFDGNECKIPDCLVWFGSVEWDANTKAKSCLEFYISTKRRQVKNKVMFDMISQGSKRFRHEGKKILCAERSYINSAPAGLFFYCYQVNMLFSKQHDSLIPITFTDLSFSPLRSDRTLIFKRNKVTTHIHKVLLNKYMKLWFDITNREWDVPHKTIGWVDCLSVHRYTVFITQSFKLQEYKWRFAVKKLQIHLMTTTY